MRFALFTSTGTLPILQKPIMAVRHITRSIHFPIHFLIILHVASQCNCLCVDYKSPSSVFMLLLCAIFHLVVIMTRIVYLVSMLQHLAFCFQTAKLFFNFFASVMKKNTQTHNCYRTHKISNKLHLSSVMTALSVKLKKNAASQTLLKSACSVL